MKSGMKLVVMAAPAGFLFLITMLAMPGSAAQATVPADDESPAFKRALPEHYFKCHTDSECVMVQGWCSTFSINKAYADNYNKIPNDPKGKASRQCPPGWLPPNPHPVCVKSKCSIISNLK
ncbi:hypothetical protein LPB67_07910 [Undibacterium sp. Jales W-56]|uniref:hypothetical protein n=1 Tax=Undibacterium sp. Jales W-56 TaxID=2897325 RepID=UPI0021D1B75C|nr:hypothetical protein [Undibacterium sp. Jales W-56]MCU6433702.1 hypothetical protein [Undibacterium sp. Jales W-56]